MKLVHARLYPLVHKMTVFFISSTKLIEKGGKKGQLLVIKAPKGPEGSLHSGQCVKRHCSDLHPQLSLGLKLIDLG